MKGDLTNMNSKLKILLACSIFVISSCSKPSNNSTSNSGHQNTPSDFYNYLPQEKNEDYLYQYLTYVGLHGNYTLTYDIEGTECYDLFNEEYYYISILNNGGVLLPYYDQSEIKGNVVYRYELDNNSINLLLPENGITTEKYYVDSINEISYFSLLADKTDPRYLISHNSFIYNKTDGKYYSNSVTLNSLLTIAVGYSSLVFNGLVSGVSFDFLNSGDISYTIYMTGLDENGEQYSSKVTTAKFSNVNCSKIDSLEKFKKDFTFKETLNESSENLFASTSLATHSVVEQQVGNEEKETILNSNLKYNANFINIDTNDLANNRNYSYVYKNKENVATVVGINGLNEVIEDASDVSWNDLIKPSDVFDHKAFRKISDNTYRYFGYHSEALFYSLTYLSFEMAIKSLDIVVENNSIKEMNVALYRNVSDEDSSYISTFIKVTFSENPTIIEPAPFTITTEKEIEDNNKISLAFNKIKSGNNFEAIIEDYGSYTNIKTKMIVADNIVYFEQYEELSTTVISSRGFVEKEGKVIPFTVETNNQGEKTPKALSSGIVGKTLNDYIGFSLSSVVFTLNGNTIVPKTNVIDIANYMFPQFFSNFSLSYMIIDTLKMNLNSNNEITKILYNYSRPVGDGYQSYEGKESITFSNYGTAKLGPNLTKKINAL